MMIKFTKNAPWAFILLFTAILFAHQNAVSQTMQAKQNIELILELFNNNQWQQIPDALAEYKLAIDEKPMLSPEFAFWHDRKLRLHLHNQAQCLEGDQSCLRNNHCLAANHMQHLEIIASQIEQIRPYFQQAQQLFIEQTNHYALSPDMLKCELAQRQSVFLDYGGIQSRATPLISPSLDIQRIILFDTNQSAIRDESIPDLMAVIDFLRQNQNVSVRVIGHTDERGSIEYNLQLSIERALAVRAWFLSKDPSLATRIITEGKGKADLIHKAVDMRTDLNLDQKEALHQVNRRVVFSFPLTWELQ